jgi:hypothetical protein
VSKVFSILILPIALSVHAQESVDNLSNEIHADITIMHRRMGATAIVYEKVANGTTIVYPWRNKIETFRVYSIRFKPNQYKVDSVVIESYKKKRLLQSATPRVTSLTERISIVDGYISTKEDRVKLRIFLNMDEGTKEWTCYVNFK